MFEEIDRKEPTWTFVYLIIYSYALALFSTDIEQQTLGIATSLEKYQSTTVNDRINRQQGANLHIGLFDHLRLCSLVLFSAD